MIKWSIFMYSIIQSSLSLSNELAAIFNVYFAFHGFCNLAAIEVVNGIIAVLALSSDEVDACCTIGNSDAAFEVVENLLCGILIGR